MIAQLKRGERRGERKGEKPGNKKSKNGTSDTKRSCEQFAACTSKQGAKASVNGAPLSNQASQLGSTTPKKQSKSAAGKPNRKTAGGAQGVVEEPPKPSCPQDASQRQGLGLTSSQSYASIASKCSTAQSVLSLDVQKGRASYRRRRRSLTEEQMLESVGETSTCTDGVSQAATNTEAAVEQALLEPPTYGGPHYDPTKYQPQSKASFDTVPGKGPVRTRIPKSDRREQRDCKTPECSEEVTYHLLSEFAFVPRTAALARTMATRGRSYLSRFNLTGNTAEDIYRCLIKSVVAAFVVTAEEDALRQHCKNPDQQELIHKNYGFLVDGAVGHVGLSRKKVVMPKA